MHRLLMGEVGSGKTVVALYALLRAVEAGQGALMAPTETLAEQHFQTLEGAARARRRVELLTISYGAAPAPPALSRPATRRSSSARTR